MNKRYSFVNEQQIQTLSILDYLAFVSIRKIQDASQALYIFTRRKYSRYINIFPKRISTYVSLNVNMRLKSILQVYTFSRLAHIWSYALSIYRRKRISIVQQHIYQQQSMLNAKQCAYTQELFVVLYSGETKIYSPNTYIILIYTFKHPYTTTHHARK